MPFDFAVIDTAVETLDFATSQWEPILSPESVNLVNQNAPTLLRPGGKPKPYVPQQRIETPDSSQAWYHEHPNVKRMTSPDVDWYRPLSATHTPGLNGSYRMGLKNGHVGIHKPENGENPEWQAHHGLFWPREVLAWEWAHHLGMGNQVPTTIAREHQGVPGSYQTWEDDSTLPLEHERPYDGPEGFKRAAAFDYLTMNQDRNFGNWLVKPSGKLALIDHGLAFPKDKQVRGQSYLLDRAVRKNHKLPEIARGWNESLPLMEQSANRLKLDPQARDNALERVDRIAHAARKGYGFRDLWDTLGHNFQHINLRRHPEGKQDANGHTIMFRFPDRELGHQE